MNAKPATMETLNRRSARNYCALGAPTKREIAAQQKAMDAEFARIGRVNEITAEQTDELAAARRRAADRIAEAFAPLAAAAAEVVMIAASAEETTPEACLAAAGVTAAEIASTDALNPSYWDRGVVTAFLKDYDDPATAARRAKRSGPGVERAAKIASARRAWLAATDHR